MLVDVVLHMGLHKTGSTFLQRQVFSRLDGVNFIHHPNTLHPHLVDGVTNLISEEAFSGTPHHLGKPFNRLGIARSLKTLFPDARVIVGFRDEASWLKSLYKQYVFRGGCKTFNDFKKGFNPDYFSFVMYENLLRELFGDVFVYYFRDLIRHPDVIIRNMCDFIGVDMPSYKMSKDNVSLSDGKTSVLRFINLFLWTDEHPGLFPVEWFRVFTESLRFGEGAWFRIDRGNAL